jgi:hypothetical protein
MRLLMLPAVPALLLLAGCGYSNEPPPARSPVVVAPAPVPRPEVVQSAAECSQPDVTYFFANDQESAQVFVWHLVASDQLNALGDEPPPPWAVVVGNYSAPQPWIVSGTLPGTIRSAQIVELESP